MQEPPAEAVFGNIANWASSVGYDDIPAAALQGAKNAILDFLGVALAGSTESVPIMLRDYLTASGSDKTCGLIGPNGRAGVEAAAFFNAAAGHILDFDDCSDTLGGHPTVAILPGILALAEAHRVSGRDVLRSYCIAYEALAHIAKMVNFEHYDKGWHPTATLGAFGSAVACATLLGLTADGVSMALSIASAFSAGLKVHFGTDMKAVQVGHAARVGAAAAAMAAVGVTGKADAFEGRRGFGEVYNGAGKFRVLPMTGHDAMTWDLVDPGLVVKQYPCCGSTHPVVDAAREIRQSIEGPDDLERVVVRLHPRRLAHTNRPVPASALEAKFSVQFAAATALVHGNVILGHFSLEALSDDAVHAVLQRLTAEPLPESRYGPEHFAGEIEIWLRNGDHRAYRVEKAKGRGARLALSPQELTAKFLSCAAPVLGDDSARYVAQDVLALESCTEVGPLMNLVTDV